ncbi:unnamed protein product [Notodromas monacha]|uniref:Nuclear transport factor 2 n=1 Tax=Notodromas monacha TaxID=399045 RepID=A0A7R9BCG1_9CRUS|nr:unnamed protein product [Notodromas monacha]CAG0912699.1 unnamed protein product [Notodromas monacha]
MTALNANFDAIGRAFVEQYYQLFDNPTLRPNLAKFYDENASLMTFEGVQIMGAQKIMEKLNSLTFRKIAHVVTLVDCQPTFDGGVLVAVFGQLKTDDDPPHTFTQIFGLKPLETNFFVAHDVFRLHLA